MFYVYVLKSDAGITYIGQTADLNKRIAEHNNGLSIYTKRCGKWTLIYKESLNSRSEAMKREKFLKTGKGRDYIKSFCSGA